MPNTRNVTQLPAFPEGSMFWDVEGDAVSIVKGEVRVWTAEGPRPMSFESVMAKGVAIDRERFMELAGIYAGKPTDEQ